jgi:hypothetical protein
MVSFLSLLLTTILSLFNAAPMIPPRNVTPEARLATTSTIAAQTYELAQQKIPASLCRSMSVPSVPPIPRIPPLFYPSSVPDYPGTVFFSISISQLPRGQQDFRNLLIDFGDGTKATPNLTSINCGENSVCLGGGFGAGHTYSLPGTYTARLIDPTACKTQAAFFCFPTTISLCTITIASTTNSSPATN